MQALPKHLQKYVVEQNYERYTPVNQACWRYILKQLRAFLSKHAHESYVEGLQKTGIDLERIPRIEDISKKLEKFGWRALPVSGFIPPAAFMELQSLGVLPIASDMRSIDHLEYTPAPDIVHEAAGHAPILIQPEFAQYLREYAQVARKAIISKEDLDVYEAIRELSDLKENPESTAAQIEAAQKKLDHVSENVSHVSEAAELGRMNWWTAEYGLIGDPKNPKIYGAGLLSSVGESKLCLEEKVVKRPISVDCIQQSYDITEPQPQLYITPDFKTLSQVLRQMASKMAFRVGGLEALEKARKAASVNTVEFNSGLQLSGVLKTIHVQNGRPTYLQFEGPLQISMNGIQLEGHGREWHPAGFSTVVGHFKAEPNKCPSEFTQSDWQIMGFIPGRKIDFEYASGIRVRGVLKNILAKDGKTLMLTFADCTVTRPVAHPVSDGNNILFQPDWGIYDLPLGCQVTSVFSGPADRISYGEMDDFVAKRVATPNYSEKELRQFGQYQVLRDLREQNANKEKLNSAIEILVKTHLLEFPTDWLFYLEAFELVQERMPESPLASQLKIHLEKIAHQDPKKAGPIQDGLNLCEPLKSTSS
jgi:phenylalanine-4-hydroxylase